MTQGQWLVAPKHNRRFVALRPHMVDEGEHAPQASTLDVVRELMGRALTHLAVPRSVGPAQRGRARFRQLGKVAAMLSTDPQFDRPVER